MSEYRRVTAMLLLGVAASLAVCGCTRAPDPWEGTPPGKKKLVVSFPPLYSFVKSVAGDDAAVYCLLTNRGPHDYPYDPKDTLPLHDADGFFVNGLDLDDGFAQQLHDNSGNPHLRLVRVADAGIKDVDPHRLFHAGAADEDDHDHHGEYDPHVWLGPPEAILMVKAIARELQDLDRDHAAGYQERADAYVKRLEKLRADGLGEFACVKKEDRNLIVTHDSLGYFARAFDLNIVGAIRPRANVSPDSQDLARLAEACKTHRVRVVTIEPQFPQREADTLVGALQAQGLARPQLVEVDPLETARREDLSADWYEERMRDNLSKLAKALR